MHLKNVRKEIKEIYFKSTNLRCCLFELSRLPGIDPGLTINENSASFERMTVRWVDGVLLNVNARPK